ncbi:hypothetical protein Fmac_015090 [Flemingia macrophylla]|uniref:Uncharacterized protein n=1 Tax=Flemingia macrophylla TaxID=520843 RepID=A0ABD1MDP3_9FABA
MVPPCITTPNIVKVLTSHHFVFPDFAESFKESKAQVLSWLYASPSARATSSAASAPRASSIKWRISLLDVASFVRELIERMMMDWNLTISALQKMIHMEASLSKLYCAFPDWSTIAAKLHTMKRQAEEQLRSLEIKQHMLLILLQGLHQMAFTVFHCD